MNTKLFKSVKPGDVAPVADTVNEAGGRAYTRSAYESLAQYVATGTFNSTYYVRDEDQLATAINLAKQCTPEQVAKTAVYGRKESFMKDVPAFLVAYLASIQSEYLPRAFPLVIDNGKMLRNFVKVIRSNALGRRSLGSRPKRLILEWLANRDDEAIFRASVGNNPSLADIIKMVHPKPGKKSREALYGWLLGKEPDGRSLPAIVKEFEKFKAGKITEAPDVPFEMLTALELSGDQWKTIADNMSWTQLRMNLNTLQRHGVLDDKKLVKQIAQTLADPEQIAKSRVFPYQLLMTYLATEGNIPPQIRESLHEALENATRNVPVIDGQVYVFPDVSGSMSSPVTGSRIGATSNVRCIDVAALVAASIMRVNKNTVVIPFETGVVENLQLDPRDSVMTNARKLASIGGGGTNCSAPLALLNQKKLKGDLLIYVSDSESWVDRQYSYGTGVMHEWNAFKARNPKAKLVCIDLTPTTTSQVKSDDRKDILQVGGFSDTVFKVIAQFAAAKDGTSHWTKLIDQVEL